MVRRLRVHPQASHPEDHCDAANDNRLSAHGCGHWRGLLTQAQEFLRDASGNRNR
jgi:hypothetical protein